MQPMLDAVIEDRLKSRTGEGRGLFRRALMITGRPESDVDATTQPVYSRWTSAPIPISTTILAKMGQIELHLTADAPNAAAADAALDSAVAELRAVLGASVYSVDGRPMEQVVGELLRQRSLTVAVAESCSGGLLASRITDVPGSSEYFDRGVVSYSNRAKVEWLDVPESLLAAHGAVSEPVAEAMAEGVRRRAASDIGIGITGIAGPGGGTPGKPVGTVCIAVVTPDGSSVRTFRFVGLRDMVKFQSTQTAMNMLRLLIGNGPAVHRD
jgi:nicotinamide-nucleotide amidase